MGTLPRLLCSKSCNVELTEVAVVADELRYYPQHNHLILSFTRLHCGLEKLDFNLNLSAALLRLSCNTHD